MTTESSAEDELKNAMLVGRIDAAAVRLVAQLADRYGLLEVEVRDGDRSIRIRRAAHATEAGVAPPTAASSATHRSDGQRAAAVQPVATAQAAGMAQPTGVLIRAPMAGTFYPAPAPGQPVFVDVGSALQMDTVVCIIESMKMMNRVEAEQIGQISTVLVSNGAQVQVGQPLFALLP